MNANKPVRFVGTLVVLGLTLTLLAAPASAQTLTWDPNGNQTDFDGTWSAGSGTWYTGTADTVWTDGGTLAAFGWGTSGTSPYTVTLGTAITTGGLVFADQNYTIAGSNTLSINAGGITANANASINAPIALGANQTWQAATGSTLSVAGNISGSYGITVGSAPTLTYTSFLPTTPTQIVSNESLANLVSAGGTIGGAYISPGDGTIPGTAYFLTNSGGTATYQLQVVDSPYTKCIEVQLTQVGNNIDAQAVSAAYISGTNYLGSNFNTIGASSNSVATSLTSPGYGAADTTLTFGMAGTVVFSGTNSYTGPTTIGGGTLAIAGAGSLGSGSYAAAITNNGALVFNTTANQTLGGVLSGNGSLTQSGAGSLLTLTASNTYTGPTVISGGTLQLGTGQSGQDGSISNNSGVTNNGALVYNLAGSQTAGYAISGSGSLTMMGSGQLTLNAANSLSGNVTVTSGTLTSAAGNIVSNTALGENNVVSVDAGAMLVIGGANGSSNQIGASQLNTIDVSGGTLNFQLSGTDGRDGPYMGAFNLNGATVISNGNSGPRWGYGRSSGVISTSGAPSTWSAPMWLVNGSGESLTFATSATLTVSGVIADYPGLGGLPLYQEGPAALILTASNTYIGATTINGGTLQLGAGLSGQDGSLATSGITDNSALVYNLYGSQTAAYAISGGGSVTKSGPGMLTLSNPANSYGGGTTVSGGTLAISADTDLGAAPTSPTPNSLVLQEGTVLQTLGAVTLSANRGIGLGDSGTTINVASGVLTYNGAAGPAPGASFGSLAKAGSGTLVLGGANVYTGATAVDAGVLNLTGSLASTAVNVASGAALTAAGNGVVAGTVTVAGGGAIDFSKNGLPAGVTSVLSLSGLTLGDSSINPALLTFNVNTSSSPATDEINLGGNVLTVNPSGVTVNLLPASLSPGTYPLITYGSLAGTGYFALNPADAHIGLSTLSLVSSGDALDLKVTGNPTPTLAYWSGNYARSGGGNPYWGGYNAAGPVTNWSTDPAGAVDAGQIVGGVSDVVFAATSATGPIVSLLDASYAINSLTITTTATVNIGGSSQSLTINAAASASSLGYPAGTGIVMQPGAGALNLSPGTVGVPASQSWTNNSNSTLTVAGNVNGTATVGNTTTLTLGGLGSGATLISGAIGDGNGGGNLAVAVNSPGGPVVLSGSNMYSGGTTITAGTLTAASDAALGTGFVTLAPSSGTAVLAFTSATPTIAGTLIQGGGGAAAIVLGNAAGLGSATVLTLGGNGALTTFNGVIGDLSLANSAATGSLFKAGSGMLTLGGSNTYTGGTTVNSGMLTLGGANALGSGGIAISSGATANFAGYSPANNVAINGGTLYLGAGGATGTITLAASANTINVSGNYQVLSGQVTGPGGFTLGGDSTPGLALSNSSNNFQGNVTVSSGAYLRLDVGNAIPSTASIVLNGALKLSDAGSTINTISGLSGNGSVFQGSGTPGNNILVVGAGNATSTFSGALGGGNNSFSLVKTGSGTLTLNGASSYTGGTTVNGGTLVWVNGTGEKANGAVTVNPGATLSIAGYGDANYPVSAADTVSLSGGTLSMDVTWTTAYDAEPYIGAVNLDSSLGTASAVVSPNGSGLRMGYVHGPGTINSTGSIANTWSTELRLVQGSYVATIYTGSGNTLNFSGVIDDYPGLSGMPLVKTGPGTLYLSGLNTYAGPTTVSGGLAIDGVDSATSGAFGAFNPAVTAITVESGATVDINGAAGPSSDFFYGLTIAGSGTNGQGALINSGADGSSGHRSSPNITLSANATIGGSGDIYMINGGYAADTLDLAGNVLTKTGSNTFFLCNTTVTAGTISVAQGTFSVAVAASTAPNTQFSLSPGATLALNGFNLPIGSLTGPGGAVSFSNGETLTVGSDNSSPPAYAGTITGNGALTKTGSGVLTLGGTGTYSGPTTINAGSLSAAASGAFSPNSAFTVNGGTLDATGFVQTIGALNVGQSGTLNLTIGDVLTSTNSGSLAGTLNLFGTPTGLLIDLINFPNSYSGSFSNTFLNNLVLPSGYQLSYSNSTQLYLVSTGPATWVAASGNWSLGTNWSTASAPDGAGQGATFNQTTGGTATVTLDVPVTLGTLQFGGAPSGSGSGSTSYTLTGSSLTMDNFTSSGTAASMVTVLGGTHTISAPVVIAGGSLAIVLTNAGGLNISGDISDDNGQESLTLAGDGSGQLILSGTSTYGGGTFVAAGTLVVSNPDALLDGSSLTVGQDAALLFAPAAAGPAVAVSGGASAVPEPGTLTLLAAGLVTGLGVWQKKRRIRRDFA